VDPARFPDVRLGLGLYAFETEPEVVAGMQVPRVVESRGRLWRLDSTSEISGAVLREKPWGTDEPLLATLVRDTEGTTRSRIRIEDAGGRSVTDGDTTQEGGGSSATPEVYLPPGTRAVSLEVVAGEENVRALGLAFYRLIG
jgi:hypothetical protein